MQLLSRRALAARAAALVALSPWRLQPSAAPARASSGVTLTASLDVYALQQYGSVSERMALYRSVLAAFEASHPGIRVQVVPFLATDANQAAILAGTAPDVFPDCCAYLSYVWGGLLYPLDPYIQRDNVDLGLFSPRMVQWLKTPSGVFALSRASDAAAYAVNLAVLDALGLEHPAPDWSYLDFVRLAEAVTQPASPSRKPRYGFACINGGPAVLTEFFGGFGASPVDATRTRQTWGSAAGVQAGSFWFERFLWPNVGTYGFFTDGTAVIQSLDMNNLLHLFLGFKSAGIDRWQLYPPPVYPRGRSTFLAGNFWGMSATTRHPDAAWELMKWLAIEPAWQRFLTKTFLWPPAINPLLDEWVATVQAAVPDLRTRNVQAFVQAASEGWAYLRVLADQTVLYEPSQVSQIDDTVWNQISARSLSVEEGFRMADQQVNAVEQVGAATAAATAQEKAYESKALQIAPSATSRYPAPPVTGVGVQATDAKALVVSTAGGLTLLGDGADVSGTSDNCTFACFPLTATEGEWTCRVTAIHNISCMASGLPIASGWLKVGLMAVSTLADDPALVAVHVTGANGIEWLFRSYPSIGAISTSGLGPQQNGKAVPALTATAGAPVVNLLLRPVWLKLRRLGDAWTPFASLDGRNWTQLAAPVPVEMAGCWFGVFACAHNADFHDQGYIRARVDQLSFAPVRFAQVGASGTPPAAGPVPSAWATMPAPPSLAIALPGGVPWSAPLPTTPAIAALFQSQPATRFAWAVLSALYNARNDLQAAFPKDKTGFQAALLQWATTRGIGSSGGADVDAPYLSPFQAQLSALYQAAGGR